MAGAATTVQYVIDTELDTLATLGNNTGELTTLGTLTLDGAVFDATEDGGFDILSFSEGDNTAFALLTMDGVQSIYSFDLAADADGNINLMFVDTVTTDFGTLDGFALVPSQVPVPAAGLLLIGGLGAMAAIRRRRRAAWCPPSHRPRSRARRRCSI